jgi:outer membrane receptor protein involved in Fe transport
MKAIRTALLTLGLTMVVQLASAQPATGSVGGSISASTGAGLAGATITIVSADAGIERSVTSGGEGEYLIEGLPASGSYELRVTLEGFAPASRTRLTLTPGGRDTVSFLLIPATAETLSITARTALRDQLRSSIQETIPERLTRSLPLIGRDFIALSQLTPGFTGNPNAPSPNGQIYWANNVIVDGASHFSKWRSAARTFYSGYPLEAVQQVQVLNSQFTPEYGEALSSITSATTRSGTNEHHGSALLFVQAGALNDQPVFAARKPPASSARFGFTMGGPISEDRTFYFASYEGRRSRSNNFVVSPAAPLAEVPDNEDEHLAFVKIDHRLASNDLISIRYNGQWFDWHNEPGGLLLPGNGTSYRTDVHTALLSATQLISTHILNQARFQFARYTDRRTDLNPAVYVSRAGYSIEGATLGPFGFGATPEDTYEGADTLSHTAGRHAVKIGTGFKYVRAHNESLPFGRGAYYFAGSPALFPQPYAFVQGIAVNEETAIVEPRSVSSFLFVQDDWRLAPRLTMNYGLRYDIEQIHHVAGYGPSPDRNNLQPRASATWSPFADFSVRAGAGLYTQQHLLHYVNRVQLEGADGAALITLTQGSPLMPAFPNVVAPSLLTQVPRDVYVAEPDLRNPYSVQAAAGATYRLFGFDVAADYVYLAGRDLVSIVDANAPASVAKPAARSVAQADATRPMIPGPNGFRKVISLGNEGRTWYRGLQMKVDRTLGSLLIVSSYTLSRTRDVANDVLPEDSRNIDADIARSDNDVRHNVTAGFSWQLPSKGAAFGGWTLSGTGQFRSSRPYNITWGDDRNGTTQNDARPGGRNTESADAYRNIDLALARRMPFGARTLELRAEAFNVLSTTNYDEYVGALSSPFFGQPVSAFPKRRLQFAAVVRF